MKAAAAFLTEGVELRQALMFVGGPEAEELVRSVDPMGSMIAEGLLQMVPFEAIYPGGRRMRQPDQWSLYAGAVESAHEKGFAGLRVLAEVTSLARPADAWWEQARWESYADRRMAGDSLAAMCCFERQALPPEGFTAIAAAHPVVDRRLGDLVPFQLFGTSDAVAIAGEVDAFSSEILRHLLRAGGGAPIDQVLDLHRLTFIDHTGLQVLHEHAESMRARGLDLEVRGGPPTLHRLTELLGVTL